MDDYFEQNRPPKSSGAENHCFMLAGRSLEPRAQPIVILTKALEGQQTGGQSRRTWVLAIPSVHPAESSRLLLGTDDGLQSRVSTVYTLLEVLPMAEARPPHGSSRIAPETHNQAIQSTGLHSWLILHPFVIDCLPNVPWPISPFLGRATF
ncbi:hypothetical protein BJX76DRAFT_6108 [Aspergillus varians]